MKVKRKGFTFIEILGVIAIITVLAILVVPNIIKMFNNTRKDAFVIDARKVLSIAEKENLTEEGIIELSKRYCSGFTGASESLEFLEKEGLYYDILIYANRIIGYKVSTEKFSINLTAEEIGENYINPEDVNSSKISLKGEANYQVVTCDGSIIEEPGVNTYELVFNPPVLGGLIGSTIDLFSGVYAYANGEVVLSETNDGSITVNKTSESLVEGDNEVIYTYQGQNYIRHVFLSNSQIAVDYTGAEEDVVITQSGTYTIEAYGAEGDGPVVVGSIFPKIGEKTLVAASGGTGGKGGYVSGNIYLSEGTIVKVNVGGQNGYNGGGTGTYTGGGATTIMTGSTTLIIAAGGGGGAAGTAGGNGTGTGGTGSTGTGYNAAAPSSYTAVNGAAGTNGGGGGSGNIYKNCTGYNQVYNSCKTGSNTCSAGYVSCNCSSCYTGSPNECVSGRVTSCSKCGYYCSSGTKSGSTCIKTCTKTYMSSNACTLNCSGACDVNICQYDCSFAAECATCTDSCASTTNTCAYGCDSCYSSCASGSNTCVAGYDNGTCNAFSAEAYNSGQGGSNTIGTSLTNTTSSNGTNSGNGKVMLTFIGA